MINSGSKITPSLLKKEKVPYKIVVEVGESGPGQVLVKYKHTSELNKRAWLSVLVHMARLPFPRGGPSCCGTPRHSGRDVLFGRCVPDLL